MIRTGQPVRVECRLERPAGWFDVRAFSPGPGLAAALMVDITARWRGEEALPRSEERYQHRLTELESIYRTVPIGLAVLDSELRYQRVNERLAELNGVPADAHIGRTVEEGGEPLLDVRVSGETVARPGVPREWPIKDATGRVVGINVANARMAQMLGYTVQHMLERGAAIATRDLERRRAGISEEHDFEFLR